MDAHFRSEPMIGDYQLIGDSQLLRLAEQYLNCRRRDNRLGLCISGQTISELYTAIVNRTYPLCSKIICLIGTNDLTRYTPVEDMIVSMNELVKLLTEERNVQNLVLLTVPPVPRLATYGSHWSRLQIFNKHLTSLSNGSNITVFEIHQLFLSSSDPPPCSDGGPRFSEAPRLRSANQDIHVKKAKTSFPKLNQSSSDSRQIKSEPALDPSDAKSDDRKLPLQDCAPRFLGMGNSSYWNSYVGPNFQSIGEIDLLSPKFMQTNDSQCSKSEKITEDLWNVESIKPKSTPVITEKSEKKTEPNNQEYHSMESEPAKSEKIVEDLWNVDSIKPKNTPLYTEKLEKQTEPSKSESTFVSTEKTEKKTEPSELKSKPVIIEKSEKKPEPSKPKSTPANTEKSEKKTERSGPKSTPVNVEKSEKKTEPSEPKSMPGKMEKKRKLSKPKSMPVNTEKLEKQTESIELKSTPVNMENLEKAIGASEPNSIPASLEKFEKKTEPSKPKIMPVSVEKLRKKTKPNNQESCVTERFSQNAPKIRLKPIGADFPEEKPKKGNDAPIKHSLEQRTSMLTSNRRVNQNLSEGKSSVSQNHKSSDAPSVAAVPAQEKPSRTKSRYAYYDSYEKHGISPKINHSAAKRQLTESQTMSVKTHPDNLDAKIISTNPLNKPRRSPLNQIYAHLNVVRLPHVKPDVATPISLEVAMDIPALTAFRDESSLMPNEKAPSENSVDLHYQDPKIVDEEVSPSDISPKSKWHKNKKNKDSGSNENSPITRVSPKKSPKSKLQRKKYVQSTASVPAMETLPNNENNMPLVKKLESFSANLDQRPYEPSTYNSVEKHDNSDRMMMECGSEKSSLLGEFNQDLRYKKPEGNQMLSAHIGESHGPVPYVGQALPHAAFSQANSLAHPSENSDPNFQDLANLRSYLNDRVVCAPDIQSSGAPSIASPAPDYNLQMRSHNPPSFPNKQFYSKEQYEDPYRPISFDLIHAPSSERNLAQNSVNNPNIKVHPSEIDSASNIVPSQDNRALSLQNREVSEPVAHNNKTLPRVQGLKPLRKPKESRTLSSSSNHNSAEDSNKTNSFSAEQYLSTNRAYDNIMACQDGGSIPYFDVRRSETPNLSETDPRIQTHLVNPSKERSNYCQDERVLESDLHRLKIGHSRNQLPRPLQYPSAILGETDETFAKERGLQYQNSEVKEIHRTNFTSQPIQEAVTNQEGNIPCRPAQLFDDVLQKLPMTPDPSLSFANSMIEHSTLQINTTAHQYVYHKNQIYLNSIKQSPGFQSNAGINRKSSNTSQYVQNVTTNSLAYSLNSSSPNYALPTNSYAPLSPHKNSQHNEISRPSPREQSTHPWNSSIQERLHDHIGKSQDDAMLSNIASTKRYPQNSGSTSMHESNLHLIGQMSAATGTVDARTHVLNEVFNRPDGLPSAEMNERILTHHQQSNDHVYKERMMEYQSCSPQNASEIAKHQYFAEQQHKTFKQTENSPECYGMHISRSQEVLDVKQSYPDVDRRVIPQQGQPFGPQIFKEQTFQPAKEPCEEVESLRISDEKTTFDEDEQLSHESMVEQQDQVAQPPISAQNFDDRRFYPHKQSQRVSGERETFDAGRQCPNKNMTKQRGHAAQRPVSAQNFDDRRFNSHKQSQRISEERKSFDKGRQSPNKNMTPQRGYAPQRLINAQHFDDRRFNSREQSQRISDERKSFDASRQFTNKNMTKQQGHAAQRPKSAQNFGSFNSYEQSQRISDERNSFDAGRQFQNMNMNKQRGHVAQQPITAQNFDDRRFNSHEQPQSISDERKSFDVGRQFPNMNMTKQRGHATQRPVSAQNFNDIRFNSHAQSLRISDERKSFDAVRQFPNKNMTKQREHAAQPPISAQNFNNRRFNSQECYAEQTSRTQDGFGQKVRMHPKHSSRNIFQRTELCNQTSQQEYLDEQNANLGGYRKNSDEQIVSQEFIRTQEHYNEQVYDYKENPNNSAVPEPTKLVGSWADECDDMVQSLDSNEGKISSYQECQQQEPSPQERNKMNIPNRQGMQEYKQTCEPEFAAKHEYHQVSRNAEYDEPIDRPQNHGNEQKYQDSSERFSITCESRDEQASRHSKYFARSPKHIRTGKYSKQAATKEKSSNMVVPKNERNFNAGPNEDQCDGLAVSKNPDEKAVNKQIEIDLGSSGEQLSDGFEKSDVDSGCDQQVFKGFWPDLRRINESSEHFNNSNEYCVDFHQVQNIHNGECCANDFESDMDGLQISKDFKNLAEENIKEQIFSDETGEPHDLEQVVDDSESFEDDKDESHSDVETTESVENSAEEIKEEQKWNDKPRRYYNQPNNSKRFDNNFKTFGDDRKHCDAQITKGVKNLALKTVQEKNYFDEPGMSHNQTEKCVDFSNHPMSRQQSFTNMRGSQHRNQRVNDHSFRSQELEQAKYDRSDSCYDRNTKQTGAQFSRKDQEKTKLQAHANQRNFKQNHVEKDEYHNSKHDHIEKGQYRNSKQAHAEKDQFHNSNQDHVKEKGQYRNSKQDRFENNHYPDSKQDHFEKGHHHKSKQDHVVKDQYHSSSQDHIEKGQYLNSNQSKKSGSEQTKSPSVEPIVKTANQFRASSPEGRGPNCSNWRSRSQSRYSSSSEDDFPPLGSHARRPKWKNKFQPSQDQKSYGQRRTSLPWVQLVNVDGSSKSGNSSAASSDRVEVFKGYPYSRIRMDNFELFFDEHQEKQRKDLIHLNNQGLGTVFHFLVDKLHK